MHLAPPLEADEQALEVVQVGERALDHPAHAPEPGTALRLPASDERPDSALAQETAVLVVVVATIGDDASRLVAGRPRRPATAGTASSRGISWVRLVFFRSPTASAASLTAVVTRRS